MITYTYPPSSSSAPPRPPPSSSSSFSSTSSYSRMSSNGSDEFFQATNHAEQTFRKMETYLQHKQLCDVVLIAGDHKIPAHRSVPAGLELYCKHFRMNMVVSQVTPYSLIKCTTFDHGPIGL